MSAAPKHRQPWPVKWIVVAILLFAVPYTFLTLRYRKPGKSFEPYADLTNRANVIRLLSAGYQRIPLAAQRPAEPLPIAGAPTAAAPGGLPAELRATFVAAPLLPAKIVQVAAPGTASSRQPYLLEFACTLPDDKQQLGGAELYLRRDQIIIAPTFERLHGSLLVRTRDSLVLLTVPAGALKPGRYHVTLVGELASRAWPLEVK